MPSTNDARKGEYLFRGRLCGYLCDDCSEPLSHVTVRLYRVRDQQSVTSRAVADPKETFAILSGDDIKRREQDLIAETETDANGNYSIALGADGNYNGEAFEIDVYCGTVPHLPHGPRTPDPVQFTITTLQPMWRSTEKGMVAVWEYCLSRKYWCAVRARFGAWVICGRVTSCDSGKPVHGVTVKAFDADWLQDDPLGSAVTDADGKYRIDYTTAAFEKTPFSPLVNIECVSGPDVYFSVETGLGTELLHEPRSAARKPKRTNVPHCVCLDLCISGEAPPPPTTTTIPLFTMIGNYRVRPVFGDFNGAGRTTAGNYAFTDSLALRGLLPDGDDPEAMRYRFRWGRYNDAGTLVTTTGDVTPAMCGGAEIGALEYWDYNADPSVLDYELSAVTYYANNPGATVTVHRTPADGGDVTVSVNALMDPNGWVTVPRDNDFRRGGLGRFVGGTVTLAALNTATLTEENFDLTGPPALKAGEAIPAAARTQLHQYRIWFEAQTTGGSAISANDRERIAIINTHYKQVWHPSWAGSTQTRRAIVLLDIAELAAVGCSTIDTELHELYSVYHPALGSVHMWIEGNGLPPGPGAPILFVGEELVSPPGGSVIDVTGFEPCAYILHISVGLLLTNGSSVPSDATIQDHIAFCKKKP